MNTELMYLVWITAFTAIMWIPYILDRAAVWGLTDTVGYPDNPKPQSACQSGRQRLTRSCAASSGR